MPVAPANGIEIFYDTFGEPGDPALLLVRGLGSQMISWREAFCEELAGRGFFVVRFDNRDVGLSTKFDDRPQYSVDDMAADAAGLLAHLGVDAAHIAGMSMGGMIVQLMAINHAERVLSMASIMSNVGGRDAVLSTSPAMGIFARPAAKTRDEAIAAGIEDRRAIAGPGFPFDDEEERAMATAVYDRCYLPAGRMRQMAAIQAAGSRKDALSRLTIPVVVIHGSDDPLVPVSNATITADAIPGASLVIIDGMGHDLPPGAWPRIIDAITTNAKRASVNA